MLDYVYWIPIFSYIIGFIIVFIGIFAGEKVRTIGLGIVGIPGILFAIFIMIL